MRPDFASPFAVLALLAAMACPLAHAAAAEAGSIARGHALVVERCARCHAVERTGESSYAPAPPFRTLHERYDVEGLAEAFAEGVVVPHRGPQPMPQFRLNPAEIDDLIAYLKSLEPQARAPSPAR
jgi:cytochrome c